MATSLKLKNVRLAFPALFEPKAVNAGDTPKFGASLLLAKNDPQVKAIEAAIEAEAKLKWGAKAPDMLKQLRAGDKTALHNGDAKAAYSGFADNMYVSANNTVRPLVLNTDKTPLTQADGKPYAGCYVNVVLELWAQDNAYGKRVNATLMGVQFQRDGDAFTGGGAASSDDFDDVTEGSDAEDLV